MCWRFRVVTILPFRVLNRASVWAVKVDEEQSAVIFLVPTIFFYVFKFRFKKKGLLAKKGYWNVQCLLLPIHSFSAISGRRSRGDLAFSPRVGGGRSTNSRGDFAPRSNLLPFLYTIFHEKRFPFRVPSIDKYYSFHIPCLKLLHPFLLL